MALTKISTGMLKQDAASSDLNIDAGTLFLDVSNNRVGIANVLPAVPLHVSGDGTGLRLSGVSPYTNGALLDFYHGGTRRGYIGSTGSGTAIDLKSDTGPLYLQASNNLQLFTDGSERMRIDSSGNVGIATTAPATGTHTSYQNLVIGETSSSTSGLSFKASTSGQSAIFFSDGTTPFNRGQVLYDHSSDHLAFASAGSEAMRIDSSGNLLVGTTAATAYNNSSDVYGFNVYANGQIASSVNAAQAAYFNRQNSDGAIVDLRKDGASIGTIQTNSGRLDIQGASNTVRIQSGTSLMQVTNGTQITFETAGSERVRIADNGKVGIGTNSPGFKLEIADDTDGAVDLLRLRNSDTTYSQSFDFSLDTGKNLSITGASGNGGVIIKPGSYGTEIRRDAGGALGAKLVLRNYSNTAGSYVRLQLAPTQAGVDDRNVTIQGENVDGNNNMAMVFKTSAGASPAEAMRIDHNGNLLIGKTSAAFTSDGHEIRKTSYAGFTRNSGLPLLVNRRTSSGDMIEFYKDSTSIGTIGSIGGANLFINSKGSGGYGRLKVNGTDIGIWWSNGFYPGTDSSYDLGVGATAGRWRNLYLSNKVHAAYIGAGTDTNTSINFDTADTIKFVTGGAERGRFDSTGLYLANDAAITRAYRTLYNGSAAANTVQYIKLYDRDSTTAGQQNLHFYMRGFNHSEYSVEVKIFIPTYSGFTTSYGTMDAGQGIEVEIICGGLSSQGNVFQEIIEVANLSSTTDNTEIWLKTQVPHATTGISISEAADSTDTLIPTGNGSGWTTTAPSNQHRVFPIKIGKTINGIHTTRDSKLGVGTSTPAVGLHVYNATQGRVAIENASRRFDLAVDSDGLGFRDQTAAVTRMTLSSANPYLFLGHAGHSWGTFHAVAQIGRTGAVANYDSGANQQTVIANNTYYGGSGYTSIEANSGASYMNLNQGNVSFFTAPATTAGSVQTFTKRLQITNGGNVGIGTASPTMPLSVQAASNAYAISMHGRSDGYSELYGASNDGSTKYSFLQSHSAQTKLYTLVNAPLLFGTNSAERMRITSGGNVGINCTNPATKFVVQHTDGASGIEFSMGASLNYLQSYNRSTSDYVALKIDAEELRFGTNNGTERMRIDSSGKVGIGGTVMDGPRLNIEGFTQSNTRTPANAWLIGRGTGGDGLAIGTSASSPYATWFQSGYLPTMGTSNHYALSFNPHGGNVGIGTENPTAKLHLVGGGSKVEHTNGGITFVKAGGASSTNSDYMAAILRTDTAGYHVTTNNGGFGSVADGLAIMNHGDLFFATAPTTGGGTNYPSGRVMIKSTGNVGISTSTPSETLELTRLGKIGFGMNGNYGVRIGYFDDTGGVHGFHVDTKHAGTVTSETRFIVRADTGRVGIGTKNPASMLHVKDPSTAGGILLTREVSNAGAYSGLQFQHSPTDSSYYSGILFRQVDTNHGGQIEFWTDDSGGTSAQRAVIDKVGTLRTKSTDGLAPTIGSGCVSIWGRSNSSSAGILRVYKTGDDGQIVDFYRTGNSLVGSISIDSSGTQYNTTSDRRLKKNIEDADDAGQIIDSIQVRKFDWIEEDIHQRYGMIAQELNTVAPEAVFVPEDEEKMQSVDYSKLVPMLVKEVQSLRARVAELEGDK